MAGVVVFKTLRAALDDGYHVYEKTSTGYTVRIRLDSGFAFALVSLS